MYSNSIIITMCQKLQNSSKLHGKCSNKKFMFVTRLSEVVLCWCRPITIVSNFRVFAIVMRRGEFLLVFWHNSPILESFKCCYISLFSPLIGNVFLIVFRSEQNEIPVRFSPNYLKMNDLRRALITWKKDKNCEILCAFTQNLDYRVLFKIMKS